jgi:hypothetical protein
MGMISRFRMKRISRIAEFISNERLCCPFLNFTLNVVSIHEPVSLSLTGPLGTQEFLRPNSMEPSHECKPCPFCQSHCR